MKPQPLERTSRADVLHEILRSPGHEKSGDREGWFRAIGTLVGDAIVAQDQEAMGLAADAIVSVLPEVESPERDRLRGILDVLHRTAGQLAPVFTSRALQPGTLKAAFVRGAALQPGISNEKLGELLDRDDPTISRLGRELRKQGAVVSHKVGKYNSWQLTPAGRQMWATLQDAEKPVMTATDWGPPAVFDAPVELPDSAFRDRLDTIAKDFLLVSEELSDESGWPVHPCDRVEIVSCHRDGRGTTGRFRAVVQGRVDPDVFVFPPAQPGRE